ncbi:5-formyltetrahydrofolate cyclo-ligase [Marinitoga aeolica]|uniref:5-formyltetrahydrofolate cyclo-ligase n=1 Tax=Marinitoga aeolica TaxID=2809031 RepID=A0ABY8PNM0_9BACT|nr:5-formyltetrahydrofolate cyclo-ligase [Marinitoga aeolica]WGS64181.1 5-formyltetrahydrofolate cyclo-ligase [Marinitoga aeolica]
MKDGIRKKILEKRLNLEEKLYNEYNFLIINKVFNFIKDFEFQSIAMYYPFRKEVNLLNLVELLKNRDILFPKIKGKSMQFIKVRNFDEFKKGKFGIMEPIGEYYDKEIDIFLVPGVAFDKKLYRLGYGGGYYDRYFSNHKKGFLIGVAFDFQILNELPIFEHDIKMDVIITEKRILKGEKI